MSYYRQHLFFCVNQRDEGKVCCNNQGATELRDYMKKSLSKLGLTGPGEIRVNTSGCLGRCQEGPSLVIYPDGIWYRYTSREDLDEIIQEHILKNNIVTRLLMAPLNLSAEQN